MKAASVKRFISFPGFSSFNLFNFCTWNFRRQKVSHQESGQLVWDPRQSTPECTVCVIGVFPAPEIGACSLADTSASKDSEMGYLKLKLPQKIWDAGWWQRQWGLTLVSSHRCHLVFVSLSAYHTPKASAKRCVWLCFVIGRKGRSVPTQESLGPCGTENVRVDRSSAQTVTGGGGHVPWESLAFPCSRLALKLPDDYSSRMSLVPREILLFIGVK